MIMFFLPWWTYVLIGTIAFACSFGAVWLAGVAFEKSDDEPFPCLAFMWTGPNGVGVWCWLEHGHDGEHSSHVHGPVFGDGEDLEYVSPGVYEITTHADEWPCASCSNEAPIVEKDAAGNVVIYEERESLPELPQRLSRVPVQTEHNDLWPLCGLDDCQRSKGHPGLCTG